MWGGKTRFKSRARSVPLVRLIQASTMSLVLFFITPFNMFSQFGALSWWAVGLLLTLLTGLLFALIGVAYGVKVRVKCVKNTTTPPGEQYHVYYRGNTKYGGATIPCQYITGFELCNYPAPWWRFKRVPIEGDHVVHCTQTGYQGAGVILRYKLPPMYEYKPVERTVILPVANAEALCEILRACTEGITQGQTTRDF
ncbi:MAG: hypothetical protein ACSHWQ_05965 [Spongiibacteraceae bacterium]